MTLLPDPLIYLGVSTHLVGWAVLFQNEQLLAVTLWLISTAALTGFAAIEVRRKRRVTHV